MLVIDEDLVVGKRNIACKATTRSHTKNFLFRLFYKFARYQCELNSKFMHFVLFMQNLQLLAMLFLFQQPATDSLLFTSIQTLSKACVLYPFISFSEITFLLLSIFLLIVIMLGAILWIPYVLSIRLRQFTKTLFSLSFYCCFFSTGLLYLPFIGILFTGMDCVNYKENSCFQGNHLPIFIICLTSAVILLFVSTLYKIFVFSIRLTTKDPTATFNSMPAVYLHLFRTILALILFYAPAILTEGLKLLLLILVMLTYFFLQGQGLGRYNVFSAKCVALFSGLCLWTTFMQGLLWYDEEHLNETLIVGVLLCGGGIIALLLLRWKSMMDTINPKDSSDINIISGCLSMILLRNACLESKSRSNWLLLSGYYARHFTQCQYPFCPITILIESGHDNPYKHHQEMLDTLLYSVNRIMKRLVLVQPRSASAKLFYISVIIDMLGYNYILAWELYKHTKNMNLNVLNRYKLYCQKTVLRKIARKTTNETSLLEPLAILRKIKLETRFRRLLEQNTLRYSQFWDILQEQKPKYSKFMEIGDEIVEGNKQIKLLWEVLCGLKCGISLHIAQMYWVYCKKIMVDPSPLKQIEERFHNASILDSDDYLRQHMGQGDGVVAVSATLKSIGKIIQANGAFCQMVGYPKDQLKNRSLTFLVPKLFRNFHSEEFEAECYVLEGGQRRAYDERQGFLIHKYGYFIPVEIRISDSPSILNTYCFIARIRSDKSLGQYNAIHFLTDPEGVIRNVTPSIFSLSKTCGIGAVTYFGIELERLNEKAINVKSLVPSIFSLPQGVMKEAYVSTQIQGRTESVIAKCKWKMLKTSKEKVIGLYAIISLNTSGWGFGASPLPVDQREANSGFYYDEHLNGFYQSSGPSKHFAEPDHFLQRIGEITLTEEEADLSSTKGHNIKSAREIGRLPLFYIRLLPLVKSLAEQSGDYSLVNRIKSKRSYALGVTAYRWMGDKALRVDEEFPDSIMPEDAWIGNTDVQRRKSIDDEENKGLLQTALRNKECVQKALQSIPTPRGFILLILVCILATCLSVVIAITQFILYTQLFVNMNEELKLFNYVPDHYTAVSEAARFILQAVAINE